MIASVAAPPAADSQTSAAGGYDYTQLDQDTRRIIESSTSTIRTRMRRVAEDAVVIGEQLILVKSRLPHGQFGPWLRAEFDWSEKTAQRFMQVARSFKSVTVSVLRNFDAKALYYLTSEEVPGEARQVALERAEQGQRVTEQVARSIVAEAGPAGPARNPGAKIAPQHIRSQPSAARPPAGASAAPASAHPAPARPPAGASAAPSPKRSTPATEAPGWTADDDVAPEQAPAQPAPRQSFTMPAIVYALEMPAAPAGWPTDVFEALTGALAACEAASTVTAACFTPAQWQAAYGRWQRLGQLLSEHAPQRGDA